MIDWKPEKRKIADLIHWEENPRKISDAGASKLRERIEARGFHDVIKIDTDNTILSGNMRKDVLERMGIEEVNVLVPERKLTVEERVLVGLESNLNDGEWDKDELEDIGADTLRDAGFDEGMIGSIFDDVDLKNDDFDEKKAIERAEKNIRCAVGDIWEIGNHRLMIGDSTSAVDVRALMASDTVNAIYCDPPYNIGLDYNKGIGTNNKYQGDGKKTLNDSKKDADYANFIERTVRNAIESVGKDAHVFYWCDQKYIWLLQTIYAKMGIVNKRVCLWIKNNQNPTPGLAFNKAYEPCVYGTIGRPYLNKAIRNLNEVMNQEIGNGNQMHEDIFDLFDIWLTKRDNATEYDHPTQKPVTLHEKPLKRCTAPGDIVLDLFLGSSSTIMACEQLNRKCYGMEQNPIFATVGLNRWEAYTGQKARLLTDGVQTDKI